MKLTPAQEEELKFLRKQVDNYQVTAVRSQSFMSDTTYIEARRELKEFVDRLRQEGYNI